jgi:hypothetical protein
MKEKMYASNSTNEHVARIPRPLVQRQACTDSDGVRAAFRDRNGFLPHEDRRYRSRVTSSP